jgi:hypothetical protein
MRWNTANYGKLREGWARLEAEMPAWAGRPSQCGDYSRGTRGGGRQWTPPPLGPPPGLFLLSMKASTTSRIEA